MSFKSLQIRYQTARSLPAPYAYFYTLTARPVASNGLQVDLAITYPDRDDIDDDELIAEGFTRDDDFSWSGKLPKPWLDTVTNLTGKTRLQPLDEELLGEDDDFWDITLETDQTGSQQGIPKNADEWHYLVQELMQAAYESIGRERPFELTYIDLSNRQRDAELQLTASFAERTVTLRTREDRREQSRTLPWSTLQKVMSQVYEHDFDPDETQLKRPTRSGQWLNLGTDEWYDVSQFRALTKKLESL